MDCSDKLVCITSITQDKKMDRNLAVYFFPWGSTGSQSYPVTVIQVRIPFIPNISISSSTKYHPYSTELNKLTFRPVHR
jgi:hypothetical protein